MVPDIPVEYRSYAPLERVGYHRGGKPKDIDHAALWARYLEGASIYDLHREYPYYRKMHGLYAALMLRGYTQFRYEGRSSIRGIHRMYDTDTWSTAPAIIETARAFMGAIDIDPATNDFAQAYVQATTYYTKDTNGLNKPWHGRLWLNPPYSQPLIQQFIHKLLLEVERKHITEAVILTNNATDTQWCTQLMMRYPVAFSRKRLQFIHPAYKGTQNRVGQCFFYIGDRPIAFYRAFDTYAYPPIAAMKIAHDLAKSST